jgi:nitroimidazol reductase NimA-like FMN-containing flavoprotein (pyridoxamine 5'-phosphate oxidase superfamily)
MGLEMEDTETLLEMIKGLLASQHFAVIATQSQGQPYSNLIAFSEADNLRSLLFVTGRDTKKYSNTIANKRVAVLVDSRTNQASDLNKAIAITALGTIEEVAMDNKNYFSEIYLSKHPELKDFLHKPSNALMRVAVTDYIVASFESVQHLRIG